ncbi:15436_t:CDS:2 [Dentiscutata erythropus]|uniref:15436_t:CDS:1 n=1 Tax=Dentiscutata erythropus TaxID=1348616 RepID=A0A9N9B2M8_9GLOM|nr:15436_t:CDS:2 [Dentiscutata erythropus]
MEIKTYQVQNKKLRNNDHNSDNISPSSSNFPISTPTTPTTPNEKDIDLSMLKKCAKDSLTFNQFFGSEEKN